MLKCFITMSLEAIMRCHDGNNVTWVLEKRMVQILDKPPTPPPLPFRLKTHFLWLPYIQKFYLFPVSQLQDIVSEHPERFFIAEIVREKIFMQYRNEVPYACQVNVVNYICRPTAKDFIQVEIVVEKNSQKIILIGKDGKALKMLATASRLDIEVFLLKKVYLEVVVKVKENWRQDESLLKNYGYDGQIRVV
ncbi:uncharacterized protein LOC110033360 [Phalaenopsis equestris]|uniref:uncharacterized protein LOC110033360 n=1 Tax=Phalaenopsis equestris TaxID=78828 RepID=UPI0009E248AE|nr:uncharacterized protein LOC110033360 [Phalaenopsis equestris]XP_020592960.1 uncharacterized protein LOC110033360 [Phalaenopsis equestris]XP_020592961.1 uncharacterized protein LOC110033360 [Phalaenopsis equestris]XP_020592962.1 uncharacterized protein LOC110033360 [Phalaenopsis equestris]XP_020592963.1 uncharacterized protein LOC110033360 [Phalaenopsis equestris]